MRLKQLAAAATLLAAALAPTLGHAQTKTLRFVAHADLKILDPTFTTAYISRNFGYMVYDTLFAQDEHGQPKPQMVDKWTTSRDGLTWTFTLRPGQKFSDGKDVTAADAVASVQRWMVRDSFGTALKKAGAEWSTIDAKTFKLQLKEPFGMVLDALAKPSGFPPVVMPERLAKMPTTTPLTEVVGSGPYLFKRDEWVPGSKTVFVRNPNYAARSEPPSGLAGSKKSHFDRIEWLYLPDSNSAVSALKKGEVDFIEQVPADYITPLRSDPNVKLLSAGTQQAQLIMNQLHPPFNNARVRQAVLKAVSQERFNAAMGYPLDMRMRYCATYFICGSANDTAAGSEPYRTPDVAKAREMLKAAGYKGEKVALLVPSDVPYLNALGLVALQTMKNMGLNVEPVNMDWASIGARRAKKDVPESGGWSAYVTVANEFAINSPIVSTYLSAACGNTLPGWPCDEKLDELRTAWIREGVPARRKQLLDAFQVRAYEAVPYINLGQYTPAAAARKELKGADKLWSGIPNLWVLDK
ncbi:ABC transporter substrate-binding protein [Ramlibacter sp. G-1-2-2]|uniref:ABC transporter substrate-binding protein n=1 Tax=Ramlibacter agri TaxID=2728837 RepID=A0A848H868_9BURK|nr:ABC transporter substrate-binding protein [Ramlibacter agri]NML46142.1 ABC transporter substrate-binding protein [Ramlibacter agri]